MQLWRRSSATSLQIFPFMTNNKHYLFYFSIYISTNITQYKYNFIRLICKFYIHIRTDEIIVFYAYFKS